MLAGGIGGTTGDLVMHSLDTVKTRQQGDPHLPPKYGSMSASYTTIYRQEGIRKGLYGGVEAAMLGSFPGTVIFFGTYEWSKRNMLDRGINPSISYLTAGSTCSKISIVISTNLMLGFVADFAASIVYVPSEVLKTRLQLQGRYNNPFFNSGYNYRSTWDACKTIARQEGFGALYSGYKATIFRDLPFSALQFAFYEQEQRLAKEWVDSPNIGLGLEIATATSAGGLAGVLTCPLDVVKTRTQTQVSPEEQSNHMSKASQIEAHPSPSGESRTKSRVSESAKQKRLIHSGPRTAPVGAPVLDTSSVFTGLKLIYKIEGIAGWFRGVGPRFVWTSVQSGTMLVLYQYLLKQMQTQWRNPDGSPVI